MRKRRYSFLEHNENKRSVRSLRLTGVSAVILVILLIIGSSTEGKAGLAAGAFGLIAAVFSLIAFIFGVQALSRQEGKQQLAIVSTTLSGVLLIIWTGICLLGLH